MPALSVVIASIDSGPALAACLESLETCDTDSVEVIVANASGHGTAATIARRFPHVQVIETQVAPTLPVLRGIGLAAARAPVAAVLDPSCVVPPGWAVAAVRLHGERGEPAIGGPVDLAPSDRRSLVAWSTYLFEYWEFVSPVREGSAAVLSGNNVTYKREALADAEALETNGFWKAFVHARMKDSGLSFWTTPELAVTLHKPIPAMAFLVSRFHYGRSYASMRVAEAGWVIRWARAVTAPILPLLFIGRQIRGLAGKPVPLAWLLVTMPLMLLYHSSWALGELCGYLVGPGRSHDALRV